MYLKLNSLVSINKDNNIRNIIAVNSMNNTYFDSDNTKSEKKEETTFDKLKELVQEGWQLIKDYYGLKIAVMDFVKDICDNINTCIDGYIESHEEFFERNDFWTCKQYWVQRLKERLKFEIESF